VFGVPKGLSLSSAPTKPVNPFPTTFDTSGGGSGGFGAADGTFDYSLLSDAGGTNINFSQSNLVDNFINGIFLGALDARSEDEDIDPTRTPFVGVAGECLLGTDGDSCLSDSNCCSGVCGGGSSDFDSVCVGF